MPEARDRVERPVDYSVVFVNRRQRGVLLDDPVSQLSLFGSPVQRLPSDSLGNTEFGSIGRGSPVGRGGLVRGTFGTWRPGGGRGHSPYRLPQGRENMPVGSAMRVRSRASNSVLPSWYPRTPLRDITPIVRALERRRTGMRAGDDQDIGIRQVGVLGSTVPLSETQREPNCSMVTPGPSVGLKRSFQPSTVEVHRMLLDITKEKSKEETETDFITPQKKLLNSIDKVEKVVMEEIHRLKSTPRAKRLEREKKLRTLMSMR